jgi:hypothetical protein
MSLLDSLSQPVVRGEVDLFSMPSTDTTCEYSMYAEYQPVVNVQDSTSKIEFKINSNGQHYLDLNDSFLFLKVKVVNKDGTNLKENEAISTTNCFLHALFSQVDVAFNSQIVSTSNNAYPYRAFIETLLSYGSDHRESQGTCYLFYMDDNKGELADTNTGYKTRKEFISLSQEVELIDKLRFDLATQHRYILNDVNVNITLTKASDDFALLAAAGGEFKIKIQQASFFIRKQILFPSVILAHQRLLEKGQVARYPYKKTEVKYFTIPQGNASAIEENLFSSSIPTRIIIGFVSSAAFNGDLKKNPFVFGNYNIQNIAVKVNNISIPIHPLQLNFTSSNYLLPYYMLFTSTGIAGQDSGIPISRKSYKDIYTLFSFDITQSSNNDSLLNLDKSGNVKLELKLGAALTEAVHCIVYSEHQGLLEIDKYRQAVVVA